MIGSFAQLSLIAVVLVAGAFAVFLYPFNVYLGFSAVIAVSSVLSTTRAASSFAASVIAFLRSRQLFNPADLESEVTRLNLIRIVAGLLVLHRTYHIFDYWFETDYSLAGLGPIAAVTAAAVMLTIGLATPLAAAFLLLFNRHWLDSDLSTYTLSTDLTQMILLVLLFAPGGTKLSVDRRYFPWIYDLFGRPTADRVMIARFCGAMSYGFLCLFSVLEHAYDHGWTNGYAVAQALTISATSRNFDAIRELQSHAPAAFFAVTKVLTCGMFAWELLFIPLVLWNRTTRFIAAAWGLLFITLSSLLLTLQWLPSFELALWALIFWGDFGVNVDNKSALDLFYDDRCNLCDRTVRILHRLDIFGVLRFKPLSRNADAVERLGVPMQQAMADLVGADPRTDCVWTGYDLYIELSKRILLIMPLWPVLAFGRLIAAGPAIYRVVADHRREWFGICTRSAATAAGTDAPVGAERPAVMRALLISYAIIAAFSLLRAPVVRHSASGVLSQWRVFEFTSVFGLTPISVFNQDYLPITENFFTITGIRPGGGEVLLPFFGASGESLTWQNWSDSAFLSDGIRWRAKLLHNKRPCYDEARDTKILKNLIAYSKKPFGDLQQFVVRYYHEDSITFDQWKAAARVMFNPVLVCTATIDAKAVVQSLAEVIPEMNK